MSDEVTDLLQHLIRNECVNDGTATSGHEARSADLLETYAHRWKFWRADVKTRPQFLPADIRTVAVAQAAMTIKGSPWILKCAEVVVATDTPWLDMPTVSTEAPV